jgi:SAM-dependent methyltransferase
MHERRYHREIEKLRDPERVARLEVPRVVTLALNGLSDVKNVLDVGTGSGLFAEEYARRGLEVAGLDVNPQMLPVAQQFVPGGQFKEGTAEQLPFQDGSFDLVFMGLLLHETDDTPGALREARRVARLRLAVLEWPAEVQSFGPPPEHRLAYEKVEALARQAGFTRINRERLTALVLYLIE